MQPERRINLNLVRFTIGFSFISIGILLIVSVTSIFNFMINLAYTITPGSFSYNMWEKLPVPIYLHSYFWNWTNPHEIYNHSVKPRFVEMGPYVFKEDKQKTNVTWNKNDTLTFRQKRVWTFDREKSVGPLTDQLTQLNPVALYMSLTDAESFQSAAHKIRNWNYFLKKGFSFSLSAMSPNIHTTQSIGDVMFHGYEDPLMKLAKNFPALAGPELNFELTDKFGWFHARNNSETFDGIFNMGTGGSQTVGALLEWNYQTTLPFYGGGECGRIGGSAGEYYTNVHKETVDFFSPEICRTVTLDHTEDVEIAGIPGKKFSMADSFLDNGDRIPKNKCYCDGDCMPYGAVNASSCRYGTPAFVTLPNFYLADQSYRDAIEGMNPDKEKHEFYLAFEPKSRVPLRAAAKLQLNLLLHPVKGIRLYENVPTVLVPVLWFEEVADIPDSILTLLRILLAVPIILQVTGALCIGVGLWLCFSIFRKELTATYFKIYDKQKLSVTKTAENNVGKFIKTNLKEIPLLEISEKHPFILAAKPLNTDITLV